MVIDGIEIEVQKKNIKNMHLYVKPPDARVLITCPKRIRDGDIKRFVSSHLDWVIKKRAEVLSRQENAPKKCSYKTGESFYLWGKEYKITALDGKRFSVKISDNGAYITYPADMPIEKLDAHVKEFYRAELKKKTDLLLPLWEEKTGLYCSSYQTKDMKTRWGCEKRRGIFKLCYSSRACSYGGSEPLGGL